MFPPVHAGVAYLLYAGLARARIVDSPTAGAVLAAAIGALLPDLIDMPLHALVAVSSTRTLAHSLLIAVPVSLLFVALVRRSDAPDAVGTGFAVGYLSHPAADALWPLLLGRYDELGYLLWPVTHSPPYEGTKELIALGNITVTSLWVELLLLAVAVLAWWRDGKPGIGVIPGVGHDR